MSDTQTNIDAELAALGEAPLGEFEGEPEPDELEVAPIRDLFTLAEPLPDDLDTELDELAAARAWRSVEDRSTKPDAGKVAPAKRSGRGAASVVLLFAAAAAVALWVNQRDGGPTGSDVEVMGVQARAALEAIGAGPGSATARAEALEARYRDLAVDSEASG